MQLGSQTNGASKDDGKTEKAAAVKLHRRQKSKTEQLKGISTGAEQKRSAPKQSGAERVKRSPLLFTLQRIYFAFV